MSDRRLGSQTPSPSISRRRFVVAGTAVGLAVLAGCGGDGGDPEGDPGDTGGGNGGDDGGDGGDPSNTTFSETVRLESSYAVEATFTVEGETTEMSGRFHDGNVYWKMGQGGQTSELYEVDDENYVVTGGQCLKGTTRGVPEDRGDPESFVDPSTNQQLTASGTATVDGTEVYVYEFAPASSEFEEGVTYYVATETGYPVRIEHPSGTYDFHSWGEVDPVRAPDMPCQDVSQPGEMGGA